jgi:hypothetical protein
VIDTRRERLVALGVAGLLVGLSLVGAGTIETVDLVDGYDTHVGERAEIAGTVVDTDPVRIDHEGVVLTVEGAHAVANQPIERGDHLVVYGTVEPDRTLTAIDVVVRPHWAFQYLYAVSLLGGLWVLWRFLRGWRLDVSQLRFVPRTSEGGEAVTD